MLACQFVIDFMIWYDDDLHIDFLNIKHHTIKKSMLLIVDIGKDNWSVRHERRRRLVKIQEAVEWKWNEKMIGFHQIKVAVQVFSIMTL